MNSYYFFHFKFNGATSHIPYFVHCSDIEKIREGIAEKVCHFLYLVFLFLVCLVISFVYGWELTLLVFPYVPIILITTLIFGRVSFVSKILSLNKFMRSSFRVQKLVTSIINIQRTRCLFISCKCCRRSFKRYTNDICIWR